MGPVQLADSAASQGEGEEDSETERARSILLGFSDMKSSARENQIGN